MPAKPIADRESWFKRRMEMVSQLHSVSAMAEMNEYLMADREERGDRCTIVAGGVGHTWASLRTFVKTAGVADQESVLKQLNDGEDKILRDERRERAEQERAACEGPDPLEDFYAEQDAAAASAAAYRNSPAGRAEALIASNQRLADAIEKQNAGR
jgi:hypothetical protein